MTDDDIREFIIGAALGPLCVAIILAIALVMGGRP